MYKPQAIVSEKKISISIPIYINMTVYFKVDDCLFLNRQKFFIVYLLCICARYLFFVQIPSFVPIRPLSFCLFVFSLLWFVKWNVNCAVTGNFSKSGNRS